VVHENDLATNTNMESNINSLIRYKLNGAYLQLSDKSKYKSRATSIKKLNRIAAAVSGDNIGFNWSSLHNATACSESLNHYHDSINDVGQLRSLWDIQARQINYVVNKGAQHIAYFSNVSLSGNILDSNMNNQIEQLEAEARFLQHIKNLYPKIQIEYRPYWSNSYMFSAQEDRAYLLSRYLYKMPVNNYIWQGHDYNSFYIEEPDFQYYQNFSNTPLVFWDNSLPSLSYTSISIQQLTADELEQYKMFCLFEPYRNNFNLSERSYSQIDKVVLNYCPSSELDNIRLATALDFLWNTSKYDPDQSLWKVLVSNYGRKNAMDLIYFNDIYFSLYKNIIKLENGLLFKINKQISDQLNKSEMALNDLIKSLGEDHPLITELRLLQNSIKDRYKKFESVKTNTIE
jgi:hypothetical protein